MDELNVLRSLWESPQAPADTARAEARAALLVRAMRQEIDGPSISEKGLSPEKLPVLWRARRLGAVAIVGLLIALGVTFIPKGLTDAPEDGRKSPGAVLFPAGPAANASEVLERAAKVADARPFVPPRPEQWVYVENHKTSPSEGPGGVATGGPLRTWVEQMWLRSDGTQVFGDGKGGMHTQSMPPGAIFPPMDYPTLAALPTDPDALLAWVRSLPGPFHQGSGGVLDSIAFTTLNTILRNSVLPPKLEAAIFRAMEKIPGVILVPDTLDVAGRSAIALGQVQEGWLQTQVLLDKKTFRYMGERSVAIADYTGVGDDGTVHVKKGTIQLLLVRKAAGVVDSPGQRP